ASALLTIINDILDFSKVEAGKLTLAPTSFSLRTCLHKSLSILELRAREQGLELTSQVDSNVPDQLIGDEVRIGQIVINLVSNAVKFTSSGGVVSLRVKAADEGSYVLLLITVTDTGIGIPAAKLQHIFEPFEQADDSTMRRFGGTGLGLTITRQLVELME